MGIKTNFVQNISIQNLDSYILKSILWHLKTIAGLPRCSMEPRMNIVASPKPPSERTFGLMLMAVLAILGIRGILRHSNWIACSISFIAGIVCGLLSFTNPQTLAPLNKAWFHLARRISKIVNAIVLGILFFGILTPVSILTRLFGRDELRVRRRLVNSYWIDRISPIVTAQSFKNQF